LGSEFLRLPVAGRRKRAKIATLMFTSRFFQFRFAILLLTLAGILVPVARTFAQQSGAASWVVVDTHSSRILMEQNGDKRRSVDGFAGVATALVAIDWSQRAGVDLNASATVPGFVATAGVGNPMGLQPGDQVSMRDLIYSVVLGADDAACLTIATNVGQDLQMRRGRQGDPVGEFVKEMNLLAAMNSMRGTRFQTPHGGNWGRTAGGVTTTRDLARLAVYAMANPGYRFYSMQAERAVAISRAGATFRFRISNSNRYAGKAGVDGVKSVGRAAGGPGAILTSKRNPEVTHLPDGRTVLYPRRVIAVADGAADSVGVAWQLLNAGWQEFDRWSAQGRPMENLRALNATR
jgi:D-alanyl-D-alanine carboxypeptidase